MDFSEKEALADLVSRYFQRRMCHLDAIYTWKIPNGVPCPVELGLGSLAKQNIALKRSLHLHWQTRANQLDLAKWYVGSWGGIRRNSEEALRRYVETPAEELARGPLLGVASWSKVLTIRDPEKYVILDARVASALNALMIQAGIKQGLFPVLPSRNRAIDSFQRAAKDRTNSFGFQDGYRAYRNYLDVLKAATSNMGEDGLARGEMLLFADAEELANTALHQHRLVAKSAGGAA